jgi:hypothetical protein
MPTPPPVCLHVGQSDGCWYCRSHFGFKRVPCHYSAKHTVSLVGVSSAIMPLIGELHPIVHTKSQALGFYIIPNKKKIRDWVYVHDPSLTRVGECLPTGTKMAYEAEFDDHLGVYLVTWTVSEVEWKLRCRMVEARQIEEMYPGLACGVQVPQLR